MPISLGFWEWGCPKLRDAFITVTAVRTQISCQRVDKSSGYELRFTLVHSSASGEKGSFERSRRSSSKTEYSSESGNFSTICLTNFFENQPCEIGSHLSEKASKTRFLKPDKFQNHSDKGAFLVL